MMIYDLSKAIHSDRLTAAQQHRLIRSVEQPARPQPVRRLLNWLTARDLTSDNRQVEIHSTIEPLQAAQRREIPGGNSVSALG